MSTGATYEIVTPHGNEAAAQVLYEVLQSANRLVSAWIESDSVPVLFGQMNFFLEFDVCFYRSQNWFDVRRKQNNGHL